MDFVELLRKMRESCPFDYCVVTIEQSSYSESVFVLRWMYDLNGQRGGLTRALTVEKIPFIDQELELVNAALTALKLE